MAEETSTHLPEGYSFCSGVPPPPTYLHLRATSGLSPKSLAQASAVHAGTWYGCYVTYTDPSDGSGSSAASEVVAMGRIIGDGAWYFHVADMAVLPTHQRRGLGAAILQELLAHIRAHCLALGEGSGDPYVTLMGDVPGRKLYERNGFVEIAPHSVGMKMATKKGWWL